MDLEGWTAADLLAEADREAARSAVCVAHFDCPGAYEHTLRRGALTTLATSRRLAEVLLQRQVDRK